jgi:hypothetical protein
VSSSPDDGITPVAAAYDRWSASYDADRNTTRDFDGRVLRRLGEWCLAPSDPDPRLLTLLFSRP